MPAVGSYQRAEVRPDSFDVSTVTVAALIAAQLLFLGCEPRDDLGRLTLGGESIPSRLRDPHLPELSHLAPDVNLLMSQDRKPSVHESSDCADVRTTDDKQLLRQSVAACSCEHRERAALPGTQAPGRTGQDNRSDVRDHVDAGFRRAVRHCDDIAAAGDEA